MHSQIYQAKVSHSRLRPVKHSFTYSLLCYAFDLDELESLGKENWFFGYNRPSLISVHDDDYLVSGQGSLKDKLLNRLADKPYLQNIHKVFLVTSARFLQYAFNPVSFFYCYDENSEIVAVLAEVNNTFGERHCYVLDEETRSDGDGGQAHEADKSFHVSPFNDLSGHYKFRFSDLRERFSIGVDLVAEGATKLCTALTGEGQAFTPANVLKSALKFPLNVFLTMPRIHWEAVKLYFNKKLPIFSKPLPVSRDTHQVKAPNLFQNFAQHIVLSTLALTKRGRLQVRLPNGETQEFGEGLSQATASIHIKSYKFFTRIIQNGDIGFGEAFTEDYAESDDLTSLLEFFLQNKEATINAKQPWLTSLGRLASTLFHWSRRNSLKGSRRNIEAHYDLSNDFFASFLDSTMTYSSGLFLRADDSLAQSQEQKLEAMFRDADLKATDHVLEIGCGWGHLAIRAAQTRGCRVTGVTLSKEQLKFARERVQQLGLESQVDFQLCDYRNIEGQYDKVLSVEMIEAVGKENIPTFIQACQRLLKPGGRASIQAITMADEHYQEYLKECDWIQKYIFPGGCLVSLQHLKGLTEKTKDLKMDVQRTFGLDYARTLEIWQHQFHQAREEILAQGFDERFLRLWNYYMSYCRAGFVEGPLDVAHLSLYKSPVTYST